MVKQDPYQISKGMKSSTKGQFSTAVGEVVQNGRGHWLREQKWMDKANPLIKAEIRKRTQFELKMIQGKRYMKKLQAE